MDIKNKPNLEFDIIRTPWMVEKIQNSKVYAQNLYAAICNNRFFKLDDSFAIIKDEQNWSASWRYAGQIVSNLRIGEDYLDYYCSGIHWLDNATEESGFVEESMVTDEIRDDLLKLGWIIKSY